MLARATWDSIQVLKRSTQAISAGTTHTHTHTHTDTQTHTPTTHDFPVIAWQKQIASPLIKAPNSAKAGEIDSN